MVKFYKTEAHLVYVIGYITARKEKKMTSVKMSKLLYKTQNIEFFVKIVLSTHGRHNYVMN